MSRHKLAYELRCGRQFYSEPYQIRAVRIAKYVLTFAGEVEQFGHRLSVRQTRTFDSQFVEEVVAECLRSSETSVKRKISALPLDTFAETYVSRAVGVYSSRLVINAIASWGVRGRNTLLKG
jgi:hypothetical protein